MEKPGSTRQQDALNSQERLSVDVDIYHTLCTADIDRVEAKIRLGCGLMPYQDVSLTDFQKLKILRGTGDLIAYADQVASPFRTPGDCAIFAYKAIWDKHHAIERIAFKATYTKYARSYRITKDQTTLRVSFIHKVRDFVKSEETPSDLSRGNEKPVKVIQVVLTVPLKISAVETGSNIDISI